MGRRCNQLCLFSQLSRRREQGGVVDKLQYESRAACRESWACSWLRVGATSHWIQIWQAQNRWSLQMMVSERYRSNATETLSARWSVPGTVLPLKRYNCRTLTLPESSQWNTRNGVCWHHCLGTWQHTGTSDRDRETSYDKLCQGRILALRNSPSVPRLQKR